MYSSLEQALLDLEKAGMLRRIHEEVDPYLEMAEITRQAFDSKGPALLFEKVKGSRFRAACNIFGTRERMDFLFRDTLESTRTAVLFKSNPAEFFRHPTPSRLTRAALAGIRSLPLCSGSIRDFDECTLADLPQVVGWPEDGGPFLTLPQVATLPSETAKILTANLGMYRVQIAGNDFVPDECGIHYQINRDIARHHRKAIEEGRALKVSVFLGGPPAHTIAAVMPMPEDLSELTFAGMLGGRRFRYFMHEGYIVSSDADFCILGEVAPELKPEGPFGDHVGYYSGKHLFPYLKVKKVLCKRNAIYPFTSVGRPPKEDTIFGEFIHDITQPMVPSSLPGVEAVHAVDASGVHPLCLAIAKENFIPYIRPEEREPLELLKTANALLGFNQVSLAKYLMLAAKEDASGSLDVRDVPAFFAHVLERVDFARDLHFQTSTFIDTLDYTGTRLNHGSKLVIAAAGVKCRELRKCTGDLDGLKLPVGFSNARIAMKGVLAIQWDGGNNGGVLNGGAPAPENIAQLRNVLASWEYHENYPWVSIVDDTSTIGGNSQKSLDDFLWLTFTRSDPAQDIYGLNERFVQKHWAIEAPLIIDATIKPRHQKALEVPDNVVSRAKEVLENAR
ncbi:UbiD family decarboxylase [Fibrobacter sp. UBA3718]|uniref:UbiD family decarboxylase n=1 Tax=Fibrobacter sp. UBA3718 TaxID=1946531 RepID=UPI0025BF467B|nr:UbiD family decarboxylase [Fibrobacter sp. UBA3718]